MKITILDKTPEEEDEIIIKCQKLDDDIKLLIERIKNHKEKITFQKDSKIIFTELNDILYFESVDDKVFAYTPDQVLETKLKLYQLEESFLSQDFLRVNKAVIMNLNKVESLSPAFGGRFEALLKNGYKVIISRNYVPFLKKKLGL
ncbi:MAG: LytTR family transcriptional regulator DNA-binding domain-containing protein [Treponema sp.]|nr:LytTR family transcriptional regulator DNA-binding domain-containing protein [Treponema sp.]